MTNEYMISKQNKKPNKGYIVTVKTPLKVTSTKKMSKSLKKCAQENEKQTVKNGHCSRQKKIFDAVQKRSKKQENGHYVTKQA